MTKQKTMSTYIEIFYNSKHRHGSSDQMSPTEYENHYYQRLGSVKITCGDSVYPALKAYNNSELRGKHLLVKYSPSIHLFTF